MKSDQGKITSSLMWEIKVNKANASIAQEMNINQLNKITHDLSKFMSGLKQ